MKEKFTHLVWLGAGSASEPENLLSTAEYVTLVEARESACALLGQRHTGNISIKQLLLSTDGASHDFTEYNLPEFSAIQPLDELKNLFPGIRSVNSECIQSTKITNLIQGLELGDQNNLLIIDILDSNLLLLNALRENGLLNKFCELHIQASHTPLYMSSATLKEITVFLEQQGYVLKNTHGTDPDVPWLHFIVNPLWSNLQLALSSKQALNQELEHTKQQLDKATEQYLSAKEEHHLQLQQQNAERARGLANKDQEIANLTQQLNKVVGQLPNLQSQIKELSSTNEQLNNRINELQTKLSVKSTQFCNSDQQQPLVEKLRDELQQAQKQAAFRLETITQLEKKNRSLHESMEKLNNQQKSAKEELLKAEAQIDLIKNLFF